MIDVWMIVSMVLPFCEIIFIAGKEVYQNRLPNGKKNIQYSVLTNKLTALNTLSQLFKYILSAPCLLGPYSGDTLFVLLHTCCRPLDLLYYWALPATSAIFVVVFWSIGLLVHTWPTTKTNCGMM